MSEMRLRHKKPLNSYVGQANYDSNQAQDQDFARNSIQMKRPRLVKQRPINEQTKKYAEILCQFVNTVNMDYRNHCSRFPNTKATNQAEKTNQEQIQQNLPEKNIKEDIYVKSQEVVSKQQQKIRKSENIITKQPPQTKKIKRDRPQIQEIPKIRQAKENPHKLPSNVNHQVKTALTNNPMQPNNSEKEKIQQMPLPNMNYMPQMPPMGTLQQMQQLQQLQQQIFQNPMYGGMNPAMFPMMPYSFPQMMNYQLYLEQLKTDPYLSLQNLMGMFPPNMGNNYIPFSKLPFQRNNQNDQKKQDQQQKSDPSGQKQQFNPPASEIKVPGENNKKKPDTTQPSITQPIDFKRKSCYHVAIAYNIHFARLNQKGMLEGMKTPEGIEKLDPTFPAKRVRLRKRSDAVPNISDNAGNDITSAGHN